MGLLDSILSATSGNQQQPGSQAQGQTMLASALALIQHSNIGGLQGLVQKFQNAGLGHLVSGWVSKGPNPPATGDQIQSALGEEHIQQYAQQTGQSPQEAKNSLAQLLPHVVDHLTPDGTVPQQGIDWSSALGALKSKFLN